jgi:hypothetical protein
MMIPGNMIVQVGKRWEVQDAHGVCICSGDSRAEAILAYEDIVEDQGDNGLGKYDLD